MKNDHYWTRDLEHENGIVGDVVTVRMHNGTPIDMQNASEPSGVSPAFRIG